MQKESEYLANWIKVYLDHKDMFFKKIKSMEVSDSSVYVKNKDDSEKNYLCDINLDNVNISTLTQSDAIVTLNTKENINYLFNNWGTFIEHTKLTVFFLNPFSEPEKRWIICPYTHHQITEKAVLKSGIKSMSSSVNLITPREFSNKI